MYECIHIHTYIPTSNYIYIHMYIYIPRYIYSCVECQTFMTNFDNSWCLLSAVLYNNKTIMHFEGLHSLKFLKTQTVLLVYCRQLTLEQLSTNSQKYTLTHEQCCDSVVTLLWHTLLKIYFQLETLVWCPSQTPEKFGLLPGSNPPHFDSPECVRRKLARQRHHVQFQLELLLPLLSQQLEDLQPRPGHNVSAFQCNTTFAFLPVNIILDHSGLYCSASTHTIWMHFACQRLRVIDFSDDYPRLMNFRSSYSIPSVYFQLETL